MRTNRSAGRKIDSSGLSPFCKNTNGTGMPIKLGGVGSTNGRMLMQNNKSQIKSAERTQESGGGALSSITSTKVKHVAEVAKTQQMATASGAVQAPAILSTCGPHHSMKSLQHEVRSNN